MKRKLLSYNHFRILTAVLLLSALAPVTVRSQTDTFGLYVAPNGAMYVHSSLQMVIGAGSKVINAGRFGTMKDAVVNMAGDYWRNDPGATFPDELGINSFSGAGGMFRFVSNSAQQYLTSGYSYPTRAGSSFPNLAVANRFGLQLYKSDAFVRNRLHFETGLLSLNGNSVLVGVDNTIPGVVTGYNENSFIATNNTRSGGYLYRANISSASGSVLFPVGTQAGSYAPLLLMFNTNTPQNLGVRVFDEINSNATSGTSGDPASVQQTWNVVQENSAKIPAVVALQHLTDKEGAAYSAHRINGYISRYDNALALWDTVQRSPLINPGSFTSGNAIANGYISTRSLDSLGLNVYLTKTASTATDSITLAKGALTPVLQADGSFRVTFQFLINNQGSLKLRALELHDTLSKVFANPAVFSIVSITATGRLVTNNAFDGTTDMNMLSPQSSMDEHHLDTVTLVLNVTSNKKEGIYLNSATVKGIAMGFGGREYALSNKSADGFTSPVPGTAPSFTQVTLTGAKYYVQEGFSPNGDGINDQFRISNLGNDKAQVWIFNKHGVLVYRNADYHNDWDGTANQGASTKKVEDGTYFYKIVIAEAATGKETTLYGFISVWK